MREASGEKFWFSPLPAPIIATDSDDLTLKQREHKICHWATSPQTGRGNPFLHQTTISQSP